MLAGKRFSAAVRTENVIGGHVRAGEHGRTGKGQGPSSLGCTAGPLPPLPCLLSSSREPAAPASALTSSDSPRKPSVVCESVRVLRQARADGAASSTSPEPALLSTHVYDVACPPHTYDVAPPSPVAHSSRLLEDQFFLHFSQRTTISLGSHWMLQKRFSKPWQPRDVRSSHLLRKRQPLQVPSWPPPCSVAAGTPGGLTCYAACPGMN